MKRHHRRRRRRQHSDKYVTPTLLGDQKRDGWGQPIPGEWERTELPEALFAPGTSSEDGMLSEATEHRGQLIFHQYVAAGTTDRVEVPLPGGEASEWEIVGYPNHWPSGTVLTLVRAS